MPTHVSALKRVRQNRKRVEVKRPRLTRVRHQIRRVRALLAKKDTAGAQEQLKVASSLLDRAVGRGVIHANTARRHKSRLTRHLNALG